MTGDVEVLPWQELNSYLGSMLKVMDGFVLVWMIVIFLALSFGLVNTLVMAVFERVREIGLMLALGMRPANILGPDHRRVGAAADHGADSRQRARLGECRSR